MKLNIIICFTIFFSFKGFTQCNEDRHSNNISDQWESCTSKASPNSVRGNSHWVEYDLGYVYPITSTYIWNYNASGSTDKGFKDVVIDYSEDGETWIELGNFTFQKATGSNIYSGFEGPDFGDVDARYILITAINNYGNSCFGLAEVKFNVADDVVIGIAEVEDNVKLQIFPNPTGDILSISYDNVEIKNAILRNVAGFEITRMSSKIPKYMDVSYLASGIYYLEFIIENDQKIIRKFVKTNE